MGFFERKLFKLKCVLFLVIAATIFHFAARAYVLLEREAEQLIETKKAEAVEIVAVNLGLQQPAPPPLTIIEYAELEAIRRGLNPALARGLIAAESSFNPDAISPKGAVGILQVMPTNAPRCGLKADELRDWQKNIRCGLQIFNEDMRATRDNAYFALQRYNGGPTCIEKCEESIAHARKVLAYMSRDLRG